MDETTQKADDILNYNNNPDEPAGDSDDEEPGMFD